MSKNNSSLCKCHLCAANNLGNAFQSPSPPAQATNEQECGDIFADSGAVDDVAIDNVAIDDVAAELNTAKDVIMSGENEIAKGQDEELAVMPCFVADSTKKTYANQMTNYILWLMESTATCVVLEQWYIDGVSCLTMHCKKKEFGREVFFAMDPKGNNCPIKLSDLTFEMFSNYLNQLKPKQQRKGVKSEVMLAGMYDLNKSGLMYMFKTSKYGAPTTDFIRELQLYIGSLKQNVSVKC